MKKNLSELVYELLDKEYPNAKLTLNFSNAYELLVATILAARYRDEKVNKIMPQFLQKYPTPEALANATAEEIYEIIKSVNLARNKSKYLSSIGKIIMREYNGKIPTTIEELTKLPGVGRKTANVVLGNALGIIEGIEVDTHIARVCYRIGLSDAENSPEKIEQDIMKSLPKEKWLRFSHIAKEHGRKVCTAQSPKCHSCILNNICKKRI